MAEITAELVKKFREKTGLPLMDCKKALTECNGDEDADALVRRADDLMYRARRGGGRNGLVAE